MRKVIEVGAPRAQSRMVRPADIELWIHRLDQIRSIRSIEVIRDFFLTFSGVNPLIYALLLETHPEFYCDQTVLASLNDRQLLARLEGMLLVLTNFYNTGYTRTLTYDGVSDLRLINDFYLMSAWGGRRPSFDFSIAPYSQHLSTPRTHDHTRSAVMTRPAVYGHPQSRITPPPTSVAHGMVGYHQHHIFATRGNTTLPRGHEFSHTHHGHR